MRKTEGASEMNTENGDFSAGVREPGTLTRLARSAQRDMDRHFWNEAAGHMHKEDQGYVIGEDQWQKMIWAHAMMALEMEWLYRATGDETLKDRLAAQWKFTKDSFTYEQLTGNFSGVPNIAVDDTGWDAMAYMLYYRVTGDDVALSAVRDIIRGGYEYYKDGDTKNALWYPQNPPSQGGPDTGRFKSMGMVGILNAALDYIKTTGDKSLLPDTLNIYQWIEENMLRNGEKTYPNGMANGDPLTVKADDMLYWMDFNVGRAGCKERFGPNGGSRPNAIGEAGSVSCMFANMGMGVAHARLYAITGEKRYLGRAVETVRAFNDSPFYSNQGVYVNDRDAWADATFAGPWVSEVLTLPGVTQADRERMYITAESIAAHCRTAEGYWKAEWSGGDRWAEAWKRAGGGSEKQFMTSGTTVGMLTAAAWLEKLEGKENSPLSK